MTDMLSFAKNSPKTRYFMLIAGDLDFYKVVGALQKLCRTILLAGPKKHTSSDLLTIVGENYAIPWEKLSDGKLNQNPFVGKMLTWAKERVPEMTSVFWNAASCPPPSYTLPEKACKEEKDRIIKGQYITSIACIEEILEFYGLAPSAPTIRYYAYSKHPIARHLPNQVQHIYTTLSKRNKVENSMLVDVLQFTIEYDAPANVVIFIDDDNIARAVEILKMGGYTMYVVVPKEGRTDLERFSSTAGPNLIAWDKWLEKVEDSNQGSF